MVGIRLSKGRKGQQRRIDAALDRIAKHYEYGDFMLCTNPEEILSMVADDLDKYYGNKEIIIKKELALTEEEKGLFNEMCCVYIGPDRMQTFYSIRKKVLGE